MTIDVVAFTTEASETSIALEVVAAFDDPEISITPVVFFEPESSPFGLDVVSLDAASQFDARAYRRFISVIRSVEPDIVHVHPNATGAIVRVLSRVAGVPTVVSTEHNPHTHFGPLKNAVNGSTNWLSDVVVANSERTAASLGRWERALLTAAGTRTVVIHNGVDVRAIDDAIDRRPPPDLPDGYVVGTAARLVPQKNLSAAVDAVAELTDTGPDVHFAIVGKGPSRDALERRATERGVADCVHFLGYLPERRDVYPFLASLDAFLFPSSFEGFGVAVAEAMAARTPVVVNDIPTTREVVGEAGVYADASDPVAFARAVERLLTDDDRRRSLADRGRDRVVERFSLEETVTRHAELYRSLVAETGEEE